MRFVLAFLAALAFSTLNHQAMAASAYNAETGEAFAEPTFRDLSMMLLMLDGIDVNNPKVADDYAKMNFCGIYKDKYRNDFEWNKVRQQITNRIASKKDYYRLQYELDGTINLDRYNFDTQDFPLTTRTAMVRVGSMILYDTSTALDNPKGRNRFLCIDDTATRVFPGVYLFVLTQPLTFDRLKLPMDEAKALLERFSSTKNNDRRLYVRFRIRITGISRVHVTQGANVAVDVKGDVVSLDVFLDSAMTKFMTSINITKF
ncbi:MAG: DUF4852 domain-containing protein [Alphaproteobacteria bacterium]|nr:MAG: DUF4852 domain-containing protein [Alphaproteobacteria bacterium]